MIVRVVKKGRESFLFVSNTYDIPKKISTDQKGFFALDKNTLVDRIRRYILATTFVNNINKTFITEYIDFMDNGYYQDDIYESPIDNTVAEHVELHISTLTDLGILSDRTFGIDNGFEYTDINIELAAIGIIAELHYPLSLTSKLSVYLQIMEKSLEDLFYETFNMVKKDIKQIADIYELEYSRILKEILFMLSDIVHVGLHTECLLKKIRKYTNNLCIAILKEDKK